MYLRLEVMLLLFFATRLLARMLCFSDRLFLVAAIFAAKFASIICKHDLQYRESFGFKIDDWII